MAEAWAGGSATTVLEEYREYITVLREFSDDHQLGIFDAGHAALTASAADAGLVYKPCGAGGGDIGILLADDPASADEFVTESLPGDFRLLDIGIDDQGVQVTRVEE